MKVELTDREQKRLEIMVKQNPIHLFLSNVEKFNFEVGDVLIKLLKVYQHSSGGGGDNWETESISSENSMAQRYVYIHKDQYGIGYIKRLQVSNGKLGSETLCLTNYNPHTCRFEVDPEYAERVFLDADFDIKALHKASLERRKVISKMNRKIGTRFRSLKEANEFFSDLQEGDIYYSSSDYTAKYIEENVVRKITISALDARNDYGWQCHINMMAADVKHAHSYVNDDHALEIVSSNLKNPVGASSFMSYQLHDGDIFYKVKPAQEEKTK